MSRHLPQAILLAVAPALAIQIVVAQHSVRAESPKLQNIQGCSSPSSSDGEFVGPSVSIAELRFDGDLRLAVADQEQIASSLKQITYSGHLDEVTDEIVERTREAWQDFGYANVDVRGDAKILSSNPVNERVAITVKVDEGRQYRLGGIIFKNNRAISNVRALRSLFPLKDGDIFRRDKVAEGLDNLRRAYGQFGYINATFIPGQHFDESNQTISFDVDLDEGKQFVISDINILGLDGHPSNDTSDELHLKRGDVFNKGNVDLFFKQHASSLPYETSSESNIHLQLDERAGTVAVTFDFRPCPVE
jgi:Surface antigen variable number repeat